MSASGFAQVKRHGPSEASESGAWAGVNVATGLPPGLPLRELLTILRRRRRVIAWVIVLITGVALLLGLQVDRTYTATALVMVEPQPARIVNVEQVAQDLSPDAPTIETQIKYIQSYDNLARTAELLSFTGDAVASLQESGLARAFSALGALLPQEWLIAAGLADAPEVAAAEIGRASCRERV